MAVRSKRIMLQRRGTRLAVIVRNARTEDNMFPAMMILGNLARRFWHQPEPAEPPPPPRFDFSEARDAYEHHASPTDGMRNTRSFFRKRR